MIETQPLEVTDFTGGITDYILDGPMNKAEALDNFFFTEHGRLSTRWGSASFTDSQLPSGEFRVSLMRHLRDPKQTTDTLLAISNGKISYPDGVGGWNQALGPSAGVPFDAFTADSLYSMAEFQNLYFIANDSFATVQKIYIDDSNTIQLRNAGLPDIPAGVVITPAPGAGSTYSYAFLFRYSYNVGDTTYLDRGPIYFYPTIVTQGAVTIGNTASIALPTSIPTPGNWDTAGISIEIYRTQDGNDEYFLSGTVTLGTPTYIDNVDDATLITQGAIYGNNGAVSNAPPPKCKVVHVVNNTGYYAHIKDGTEVDKYAIYQSIPGDPDSVPTNFFEKTEQEITSVSSIYDRPMALCKDYIYRIDGFIGSDGTGVMDLRRIDDRAGCVSHNSVVQTHKGLFWAGTNGFYWSDGFKVMKISDGINETYQNLVSNSERASRICGTYDPNNERVFWSVSKTTSASNEVDRCFVVDLRFEVRKDSTFTTMSGGTSFMPTSLLYHKDPQTSEVRVYRGDSRGYVFYHQDGIFTDPEIDLLEPDLGEWATSAIIYDYKSCFLDFGSKFYRKFVPRILVSADNRTNLSMKVTSNNDRSRVVGELKAIRYRQNIIWGDSLPAWGTDEVIWNVQGVIEQWRRFPAKSLRCQYKQIQFTNGEEEIISSDLLGTVTLNPTLKTATLGGTKKFPPDLENYSISFDNDNYVEEYDIVSGSDTTLVFVDPESLITSAEVVNFKISGIPKNEILVLNGYVFHWAYLSKSHTPYTASTS